MRRRSTLSPDASTSTEEAMITLGLKVTVLALAIGPLAAGCSSSSSPASGTTEDGGGGGTEAGGSPTISITSPAPGATVTVTKVTGPPAQEVVPVSFTVTNFTLMAPGTCPGGATNTSCGHVHLLIDGTTCTPTGAPYNNAATVAGTPVNAILSSCPTINGPHTVTLELHKDDHSPLDGPSGAVISAQVMITATGG
jgi:hypothetical protein